MSGLRYDDRFGDADNVEPSVYDVEHPSNATTSLPDGAVTNDREIAAAVNAQRASHGILTVQDLDAGLGPAPKPDYRGHSTLNGFWD